MFEQVEKSSFKSIGDGVRYSPTLGLWIPDYNDIYLFAII